MEFGGDPYLTPQDLFATADVEDVGRLAPEIVASKQLNPGQRMRLDLDERAASALTFSPDFQNQFRITLRQHISRIDYDGADYISFYPGDYALALGPRLHVTVCSNDASTDINALSACVSDSDGDGVPDCSDACPHDEAKVRVGYCGCG